MESQPSDRRTGRVPKGTAIGHTQRRSVRDFLRQVSEQASPESSKATKFKASLENLIESATDEEIEGIMVVIARKWRLRNSNQEKELCA